MYHGIGPGETAEKEKGEELYRVSRGDFREQMEYLHRSNFRVVDLENLAGIKGNRNVILTFDDGDVTNCTTVFPILSECGFIGHFFIIVGEVGQKDRMDWQQIRELEHSGQIIGSHGMTHRTLTGLSEQELDFELRTPRKILEDKVGCPIRYLSIPKGHYNRVVLDKAKRIGYQAVYVSELGRNNMQTDNFLCLKRIPMKKHYTLEKFKALLKGKMPWKEQIQTLVKKSIQGTIGVKAYEKARAKVLTK